MMILYILYFTKKYLIYNVLKKIFFFFVESILIIKKKMIG